nr:redoxin domain-containing protein [Salinibacter ruber]
MHKPSAHHYHLRASVLIFALSAASLLGLSPLPGLSPEVASAQPESAEIGKQVPGFEIEALRDSGRAITPSDFEGRYVLLNLWATWCGPCIEKISALQSVPPGSWTKRCRAPEICPALFSRIGGISRPDCSPARLSSNANAFHHGCFPTRYNTEVPNQTARRADYMAQVAMVQVAAPPSTTKNGQDRAAHEKKEGKY